MKYTVKKTAKRFLLDRDNGYKVYYPDENSELAKRLQKAILRTIEKKNN